ncbi:MAG: hypothetical protein AB8G77_13270 [Rhodothermales bacterium]
MNPIRTSPPQFYIHSTRLVGPHQANQVRPFVVGDWFCAGEISSGKITNQKKQTLLTLPGILMHTQACSVGRVLTEGGAEEKR